MKRKKRADKALFLCLYKKATIIQQKNNKNTLKFDFYVLYNVNG